MNRDCVLHLNRELKSGNHFVSPTPKLRWKCFSEWYRMARKSEPLPLDLRLVVGVGFPEFENWVSLLEAKEESLSWVGRPKMIWKTRLKYLEEQKQKRKIFSKNLLKNKTRRL